MSQIKGKLERSNFGGNAAQGHTVGNTYGARRQQQTPLGPIRHDQFQAKRPQREELQKFSPNAEVSKTNRLYDKDTPYKPRALERTEKGSLPHRAGVKPPSDPAILNFLNKITGDKRLHTSQSIRAEALAQLTAKQRK